MEWDKNTKIIVAVVVVVVVIAAAIGIGIATNNNNSGSGDQESGSAIRVSIHGEGGAELTKLTIINKEGKTVDLTYLAYIDIPSNGTTIKSESKGWTWSDADNVFYKGRYAFTFTVDKGKLTPVKNSDCIYYKLSYEKGTKIDATQNDFKYTSELVISDSSKLGDVKFYINDVDGAKKYLTANSRYVLSGTGNTKICVDNPNNWTWDADKSVYVSEDKKTEIEVKGLTTKSVSALKQLKSGDALYELNYKYGASIVLEITVSSS